MEKYYIGLMSGTSLDGIDAVLVNFSLPRPQLIASHCYPIPDPLRQDIVLLCQAHSQDEINLLGQVDRQLGNCFGDIVNHICKQADIDNQQIIAIGSHGQTVRHYPSGAHGFSLQIGDPNTIAALTSIDVIADFRKRDIALGGQGAPLVPAFHQAVFSDDNKHRIIINIGGMANITSLPDKPSRQPVLGFDTGPGNTLLDQWCQLNIQQPYDKNGDWARSGRLHHNLFNDMLSDPYFSLPAPKSTGREHFNIAWLKRKVAHHQVAVRDVQHTLSHLTAYTIAEQVKQLNPQADIFLCGGGAHNTFLIECLTKQLNQCSIATTEKLGIPPDWVEAMAFAWLAKAFKERCCGNIPGVTGASKAAILGALYPA